VRKTIKGHVAAMQQETAASLKVRGQVIPKALVVSFHSRFLARTRSEAP